MRAIFSEDRLYRYTLSREWGESDNFCMFIGLNPSTADEKKDDPTIRRCVGFAKDWGYDSVFMVNLFSLRATDPKDMLSHPKPIGDSTNMWIQYLAEKAGIIVCAWGAHGRHLNRDKAVIQMLQPVKTYCLGVTKGGQPRHPLYIKADTKPVLFK